MYFIQVLPQQRVFGGLLLVSLLSITGCSAPEIKPALGVNVQFEASPEQRPEAVEVSAPSTQITPKTSPAATAGASEVVSGQADVLVVTQSTATPVIKDTVSFLLGEAGWAFSQDRLTTPKGNSAYDYLQRVLVEQPKNPQVLIALEQIVQRYYELVRRSLKQGKVAQAQVYLSRALRVLPAHAEGSAMLKLIAANQPKPKAAMASMPVTQNPALRTQVLALTSTQLQQQDEATVAWLTRLALKAQSLKATMLIVAPKDAQARWLYQTMNSADPELRIRANIKRGTPARIEVNYVARMDELEVYAH
ncbi:MAG: hypothetical protein HOH02_04470 [Oceanospirillaceae bacterium]|jgi:hypothetical protein|nr:hypothetical protein [Oceanospirillaceae bacterium]MBT6077199.1 hypothetical protein [Oceanospirillaceae bacterium]MBT7330898.1 hypothetical protein [Oceanospirillaceae bacterium]